MALGVDGVRVGMWTSPETVSGVTVVLPPPGTIGAIAVRGSAPGTREAAALGPHGQVDVCHGVVLAGGSAYGLGAADGVMRFLEENGTGFVTPYGVVPIVGAAILYDEAVAKPHERPGPDAGFYAASTASLGPVAEGPVGAGAGCTVAKQAGMAAAWRSGQGVAIRTDGAVTVGVVVANNAVGSVFNADGTPLCAPRDVPGAQRVTFDGRDGFGAVSANTVIGCVVTNATLTKRDVYRLADLSHSGVARAIRPAHTTADGDALFALATGQVQAPLDLLAQMAADAVEDALRRAVLAAPSRGDLPGHG
jgi:L-aminopeptidase/D-esterase-like protein